MTFYIRVPSLITPVHCITQTEEPSFFIPQNKIDALLAGLLAERLAAIAPTGLERVFFANSGTETVEAAIKFSRYATGRSQIVSHIPHPQLSHKLSPSRDLSKNT
jgi:acetylornithine/succinyldiaminopimelate/putrescine aminotransferase